MSEVVINGVPIGNATIRPVREGVTIAQARQAMRKDGLDNVLFSTSDGKLYMAYGENLDLSGVNRQAPVPTRDEELAAQRQGLKPLAPIRFGNQPITIEATDDQFATPREGVKKRLGVLAGGVMAGGAVGGGLAVIAGAVDTAKSIVRPNQASAGLGAWTPLAFFAGVGAAVGGIAIAHGAIKGANNKVDMQPLNAVIQP